MAKREVRQPNPRQPDCPQLRGLRLGYRGGWYCWVPGSGSRSVLNVLVVSGTPAAAISASGSVAHRTNGLQLA